MKKKINVKYLLYLITFTILPTAFSQESLSLSEAIQQMLANNFQITIADKEVEKATNNNSWGEAGRYPSISLNVTNQNTVQNTDNPTSFVNGRVARNAFDGTVDAGWTIFGGNRVNITKKRLEELQYLSEGNAAVVLENSIQATILAYYRCVIEDRATKVLREVLELSKDRFKYAQTKKELGHATTFELLRDKSAFLTDSADYATQELNYKNAVRNLNLLLAKDIEIQYTFSDSLLVEYEEYDLDGMLNSIKNSNRTLLNQYINQNILKHNTGLEKSNLFPSLTMNAGLMGNKSFIDFENGAQTGTGQSYTYYMNFTLSFTLFNGGKVQRAIQNAKIDEEIGNLEIKEMELSIKNDIISQYELYELRKTLIKITEENVKTTELNQELAKERYKNGTITSFEYRDIQLNYLNTSLDLLRITYDLLDAETELMRLSGNIITNYTE